MLDMSIGLISDEPAGALSSEKDILVHPKRVINKIMDAVKTIYVNRPWIKSVTRTAAIPAKVNNTDIPISIAIETA